MSARRSSGTWQPDLFNGEGIQRAAGMDRTDEIELARQEMRDTGSADLFDVLADDVNEWEMAYGERMPMRSYTNRCAAGPSVSRAGPSHSTRNGTTAPSATRARLPSTARTEP